jgi:hypothetical protein
MVNLGIQGDRKLKFVARLDAPVAKYFSDDATSRADQGGLTKHSHNI